LLAALMPPLCPFTSLMLAALSDIFVAATT